MSEADTKASNRARFAWVVAIVDELRDAFGPDVRVACIRDAKTGEILAGKPIPGSSFKAR